MACHLSQLLQKVFVPAGAETCKNYTSSYWSHSTTKLIHIKNTLKSKSKIAMFLFA